MFPSLLKFYSLEPGYFIIFPENKYKNNLIFIKNYFKGYSYHFFCLYNCSPLIFTIIDTL